MVIYSCRSKSPPLLVSIGGANIEVVSGYRYLVVHLNDKLDWSFNTTTIYKKGQRWFHFLCRLRPFNMSSKMLHMFYKSVVESGLRYAAVCWGSSQMDKDRRQLDKLIKWAGSVVGRGLDNVGAVVKGGARCRESWQIPTILCTFLSLDKRAAAATIYYQCTARLSALGIPSAIRLHKSS